MQVQPAYLTMQYINDKFGYLSGYRQETNGAYYSKCYKAHILDGICNVDELCAFEREKNSWPAVTRDEVSAWNKLPLKSYSASVVYVIVAGNGFSGFLQ